MKRLVANTGCSICTRRSLAGSGSVERRERPWSQADLIAGLGGGVIRHCKCGADFQSLRGGLDCDGMSSAHVDLVETHLCRGCLPRLRHTHTLDPVQYHTDVPNGFDTGPLYRCFLIVVFELHASA
jgi:hypothetical protein